MKKLEILFSIESGHGWATLHLYCPKTKGYSSQGGKNLSDVVHLLLQWPVKRNAHFHKVTPRALKKIMKEGALCAS